MRIVLFVKSKRRTQTTGSIARGLEHQGHELLAINEGKRRRLLGRSLAARWAIHSVRRFRPDFVFIHAQDVSRTVFDLIADEFRTVMFTPDCWKSPLEPGDLGLATRVDLLCTVAKGQLAEFEAAGVTRAAYLAEAHDPEVHYPIDDVEPGWQSDVAFIGKYSTTSKLHATRGALIPPVAKHCDLKLYGRGWDELDLTPARDEVYPEHYREICRGAKIVLGSDWRHDCAWYFSNRTWFTLGCRGFLLTNYTPGLEDIFENHRELVWYESVDECLELIDHYLARPAERARIADAGHEYALAHRTYDHFARDLVDLVEGRPTRFPPNRASRSQQADPGLGSTS